ncbi:MAG: NAD(P)/FAD-dependent oxidoreductase [FCB group bacterium]
MQLSKPRVLIIGGGFGGLTSAKSLRKAKVDVILVDKTNHHLFQPLLYQVATAALSPGDIAIPLRAILRKYKNTQVIMDEALKVDLENRKVVFSDGTLSYDYLILAPGSRHSYFGHPEWEKFAPGIKSLKDALEIRERVLLSFEMAERNYNTPEAKKYLNFVIIGGGPTGVELAGSIAEIARKTMLPDFPLLNSNDIKIYLLEAGERILSTFNPELSNYTNTVLQKLGVEIQVNTRVLDIQENIVQTTIGNIDTVNAIWAAGNEASPLLKSLNVPLDNAGRVLVNADLSILGHPNVFVIGDACFLYDKEGKIVPGVAPAANQEAEFVADNIKNKIPQEKRKPFNYHNKGTLATIGIAKAIADFGKIKFTGFIAWFLWSFLHILFLINYRNKYRVFLEWCWYYITNQPGARLIVYNKKRVPH